jgi:uncharacterized membrane-anchored protein YhcB (DUF1043 family)
MKPGYWIAVSALLGGIAGYVVLRLTGWLDANVGIVVGILIGALVYSVLLQKKGRM